MRTKYIAFISVSKGPDAEGVFDAPADVLEGQWAVSSLPVGCESGPANDDEGGPPGPVLNHVVPVVFRDRGLDGGEPGAPILHGSSC